MDKPAGAPVQTTKTLQTRMKPVAQGTTFSTPTDPPVVYEASRA